MTILHVQYRHYGYRLQLIDNYVTWIRYVTSTIITLEIFLSLNIQYFYTDISMQHLCLMFREHR